jgi:(4S)-4-hydroxy-5-phosphonooxypentane-2,3-dione isomerase
MVSQIVSIWVKPDSIPAFIEATRRNHLGSRQEPGNLRFDVMQNAKDPASFTLVEVFVDQAAIDAHRKTDHYQEWRATVEPMMAQPRIGVLHQILFPTQPSEGEGKRPGWA